MFPLRSDLDGGKLIDWISHAYILKTSWTFYPPSRSSAPRRGPFSFGAMSMLAGNRAGPESGFQHVRKQPNDRAPARPSSSLPVCYSSHRAWRSYSFTVCRHRPPSLRHMSSRVETSTRRMGKSLKTASSGIGTTMLIA